MEEQADALTLKKGSPKASIRIFEAFLIVTVEASLPMAHTAMHLTAGSSTDFEILVGPDFLKFLISESRHGWASGRPMPPIAAAITSLTWVFSSLSSWALSVLTRESEIYRLLTVFERSDIVSSLKMSSTFSIVKAGSSANPVCTFCMLKFWRRPPRADESDPGVRRLFKTSFLSS